MDDMLSYVFGSLQTSEKTIRSIKYVLRNQAKLNRTLTAFALILTAHTIIMEIHSREQSKKVKKLSKEIKELQSTKGG